MLSVHCVQMQKWHLFYYSDEEDNFWRRNNVNEVESDFEKSSTTSAFQKRKLYINNPHIRKLLSHLLRENHLMINLCLFGLHKCSEQLCSLSHKKLYTK